MKRLIVLATIFTLIATAGTGWAKDQIELLSKVEVEVVKVNEKGEKEVVREPAAKVVPGETVIYTNVYRNIGTDPAENVVVTNPVPENLAYVGGSAFGDGTEITFSVNGGKEFALPEKLYKMGEDGKLRLARPAEYTHIRWVVKDSVKPGASGDVGFRARLQ